MPFVSVTTWLYLYDIIAMLLWSCILGHVLQSTNIALLLAKNVSYMNCSVIHSFAYMHLLLKSHSFARWHLYLYSYSLSDLRCTVINCSQSFVLSSEMHTWLRIYLIMIIRMSDIWSIGIISRRFHYKTQNFTNLYFHYKQALTTISNQLKCRCLDDLAPWTQSICIQS